MFSRGSGSGLESKRSDESFYRGIVVKNNDPLKMNRVKVFIPEISNQPYEDWFEDFDRIYIKSPGKNLEKSSWKNIKLFEKIANTIPWAEPCFPLMGESGNSRYYSTGEITTISDSNYEEGFPTNDTKSVALSSGSFSPAYLYENYDTLVMDSFVAPTVNMTGTCNPFSACYRPSKHVNKTKGVIGIPEIGSKVWVFHYQGDLQFPVYFGVMQDQRSMALINGCDNKNMISETYPTTFENEVQDIKNIIRVDP